MFIRSNKGASLVNYAILVAFAALFTVGSVFYFSGSARAPISILTALLKDRHVPETPRPNPEAPPAVKPVEEYGLTPVENNAPQWWQRAQGGRSNMGTVVHIGGGLFFTHNHGQIATNPDLTANMMFQPQQPTQHMLAFRGVYNFSPGDDTRVWKSSGNWRSVPAIPLLIASDPTDLNDLQGRAVGWPMIKGTQGHLWHSAGKIAITSPRNARILAPISGGMSGSMLILEASFPGVGSGMWSLGSLATAGGGTPEEIHPDFPIATSPMYNNGNFTLMNTSRYARLTQTAQTINDFSPNDMTPVVLLGAQRADAAPMDIIGSDWPETIVSGRNGGAINAGGGQNTIHITGPGPNAIATPQSRGNTVIKGYRPGRDSVVSDENQNVIQTRAGSGLLLSWDTPSGPATMLLEGANAL